MINESLFRLIRDKQPIRGILDMFINDIEWLEQEVISFIPVIFSREHHPGGDFYAGHRPIAVSQSEGEVIYILSTSDSNYSRGTATLKLSQIEYLGFLR
jgi:hypothetical protein